MRWPIKKLLERYEGRCKSCGSTMFAPMTNEGRPGFPVVRCAWCGQRAEPKPLTGDEVWLKEARVKDLTNE